MDEDEHKEIDRTHNLNSARTFFYQGEAECDANMKVFIHCIDAVKGKNWEAFKKKSVEIFHKARFLSFDCVALKKNPLFFAHQKGDIVL